MNVDYYKILEIDKAASSDDIKKAYRRLSLKYHPDKNANDYEKTEKFKQITEAYQTLGIHDKKVQYDIFTGPMGGLMGGAIGAMSEGFSPQFMNSFFGQANGANIQSGQGMQNGSIDMTEFMNMMFSQPMEFGEDNTRPSFMSQHRPHQRHNNMHSIHKPKSIKKMIEITIEQSYTSSVLPLEIERWVLENNMRTQETETLYITIPKGVDNNELIVVKNKGNAMSEHLRGDVKVIIKILPHELYERKGLDLIIHKDITFKDSICGFSFNLNHLDGRSYKINSDSGFLLNNNNQKVIDKFGIERDEHKGNLIIIFKIIFPEKFTPEQIEKLNEIL
jgi:DnaJ-class molecular chaperone